MGNGMCHFSTNDYKAHSNYFFEEWNKSITFAIAIVPLETLVAPTCTLKKGKVEAVTLSGSLADFILAMDIILIYKE